MSTQKLWKKGVILTNQITVKWSFDREKEQGKKFNKQNHFAAHHTQKKCCPGEAI